MIDHVPRTRAARLPGRGARVCLLELGAGFLAALDFAPVVTGHAGRALAGVAVLEFRGRATTATRMALAAGTARVALAAVGTRMLAAGRRGMAAAVRARVASAGVASRVASATMPTGTAAVPARVTAAARECHRRKAYEQSDDE